MPGHRNGGNSQTSDNDRDLFEQAAAGDLTAREEIILNHITLVNQCVNMYAGKGVPNDDLFQEGCYGLILALDRYNPDRNTRFSGFARAYILKYIRKAVIEQNSYHSVTIKEDLFYAVSKYMDVTNRFYEENHRPATDNEVAELMCVRPKKIQELKGIVFSFFSPTISLDNPACVDRVGGATYSRPVEDELFHLEPSDICLSLTEREENVLRRRLGFTPSGKPETWEEISVAIGLSIQSLNTTYNSGLRKLRKAINQFI